MEIQHKYLNSINRPLIYHAPSLSSKYLCLADIAVDILCINQEYNVDKEDEGVCINEKYGILPGKQS